jgi:hypothetical protein
MKIHRTPVTAALAPPLLTPAAPAATPEPRSEDHHPRRATFLAWHLGICTFTRRCCGPDTLQQLVGDGRTDNRQTGSDMNHMESKRTKRNKGERHVSGEKPKAPRLRLLRKLHLVSPNRRGKCMPRCPAASALSYPSSVAANITSY